MSMPVLFSHSWISACKERVMRHDLAAEEIWGWRLPEYISGKLRLMETITHWAWSLLQLLVHTLIQFVDSGVWSWRQTLLIEVRVKQARPRTSRTKRALIAHTNLKVRDLAARFWKLLKVENTVLKCPLLFDESTNWAIVITDSSIMRNLRGFKVADFLHWCGRVFFYLN